MPREAERLGLLKAGTGSQVEEHKTQPPSQPAIDDNFELDLQKINQLGREIRKETEPKLKQQ